MHLDEIHEGPEKAQIVLDLSFVGSALGKLPQCVIAELKEKDKEISQLLIRMQEITYQNSINVLRAAQAGAGFNPQDLGDPDNC